MVTYSNYDYGMVPGLVLVRLGLAGSDLPIEIEHAADVLSGDLDLEDQPTAFSHEGIDDSLGPLAEGILPPVRLDSLVIQSRLVFQLETADYITQFVKITEPLHVCNRTVSQSTVE